jgi:phenylalanyl-tRNA synthetase beta chain
MKVVYNWLKDFVDVTAPAEELASRLALSGTNIGGLENGPHGPVMDAEVSSNRPDCLGHYGIAREVSALYKLPLKSAAPKPVESSAKVSDALRVEIQAPELCGRFTARVIRSVKIQVAEGPPGSLRCGQHQQRRGRDELRHARAGPRTARV